MHTEKVGAYEIEYAGVPLEDVEGWAAVVAVYGPSHNPMHRNILFPQQRVAVDTVFATEREAEQEACRIAREMAAGRPG